MSDDLLSYGARLNSAELTAALDHVFQTNDVLSARGRPSVPVCIWGTHGLGKTTLVKEYCRRRGWQFVYIAPAQFEEMGDLHGMPIEVDPDPDVIGDEYTIFAPPQWVPRQEGPGILLLDDFNRADDRILRGLMQLLQNFELTSWKLPARWQIVATANPEGGDYSVTPMDDAMLTRMLSITMVFDVKTWARWAIETGVDPRGIAFVLTYPEVVTGKRVTPRSLTQFFEQLSTIDDLQANLSLVNMLAMSALDDITTATFLAFVQDGLSQLLSPEDILDAEDAGDLKAQVTALAGPAKARRVDRLATICTRLFLHLTAADYAPQPAHRANLIAFLMHDSLPNDLRLTLHKDLLKDGSPQVKEMLKDKQLARLLLAGM